MPKPTPKPELILAVDPGDEHVGVAWFDKQEQGWACVYVEEMTPDEFQDYIGPALRSGFFRYFVLETFALYGDKALEQTGSQFLTSQLIGVCKYVVNEVNRESHLNPDLERGIELVLQPPSIKKAIFAILKRKKYQFAADRLGVPAQHVRDAEVHGVKFIKAQDWPMRLSGDLWDEPHPEHP